ncbi:MAG TPA: hypothetical protein VG324_18575 [Blastocatellia bacterium]|nr:hypothetical protein [Blastocatellia bacterium]
MNAASQVVKEFFEQYELSRNTLDLGLIVSQYPDSFMWADPNGARVVERQVVLASLHRGLEFLKTLGHKFTKVLSLDETGLDDRYALVRVEFLWRFEKASAQPIDVKLDSTFILYLNNGSPKIVFQHEREDFQQALRARGVLPAPQ